MPSAKDIKRRQKSVRNTKQVTRAVGMVAAVKMRKAQLIALQSRPYAQKALSILANIKAGQPDIRNIFLDGPPTKDLPAMAGKLLAIVVTSDKGLCGGLNSAVIKESQKLFRQYKKEGYETELLLVGAKSKPYFERMKLPILRVFKGVGDYATVQDVKPISAYIQETYATSKFSKIIAIYTEFISTLRQTVARRQILPIIAPGQPVIYQEYIFEPSPQAVLENLIPFLLDIYTYHIILESNASEHSARMVAMKNATDNAEKILGELTLSYNKERQAAITREITEITAGVEALR